MKKTNNKLMLSKDDYTIIMSYVRKLTPAGAFSRDNVSELETELKNADVVSKEDLPADVVRLNSTVLVKEENADKVMQLKLVVPDKADIKEKRISIMSPIGTALLGFRKGQQVNWRVPAGYKTFTIMDVQ